MSTLILQNNGPKTHQIITRNISIKYRHLQLKSHFTDQIKMINYLILEGLPPAFVSGIFGHFCLRQLEEEGTPRTHLAF
ncbi:hypothetical protein SAMN05216327_102194 [Dyadobacter sp. SG02]|nr:hypothetical protein SAMN05216327_102194 [Dyadobacter sp. SG02]